MHLDCVFSPLHEKLVVVDETITKKEDKDLLMNILIHQMVTN